MNPDGNDYLFGDKPLSDPSQDVLGREALAENLAKGLLKTIGPEGYVVAIFGPWGSGKSTILKFVQHFLRNTPGSDPPVIVEFNPWWFSGGEDLTRLFFGQLLRGISRWCVAPWWIRRKFAAFVELVSHVPGAKAGKPISEWIRAYKTDVTDLKAQLAKVLRKENKRVVVFIDDVDRLLSDEILNIFRLVKAVGDLPNVMYVLAFDKKAVADAITLAAKINGDAYLEKMVQLPIELPMPDRISIQAMFAERVFSILTEKSVRLFDKSRWREVYLEGIDRFLRTPRDVVRLTNALKLTYPMVKGEVDPVDFITLEALRIFRPLVYDEIRFHPEEFSGSTPSKGTEKLAAYHLGWMERHGENSDGPVFRILVQLFPRFECAFHNIHYEDLQSWRRDMRACSRDKLPIYFGLALPAGDISKAELDELAALSHDSRKFADALLNLLNQERPDGKTRVCQALEQLCDLKAAIFPREGVASAIKGLLDVGDELIQARDSTGFWGVISNKDRIAHLVLLLVRRLEETQRLEVLKDSVETGKALSTIVEIISALGDQHGKYSGEASPEEERLLGEEDLSVLERLAGKRIVEGAQAGGLMSTPEFVHVLYRWKDWNGKESLSNWLEEYLTDDDNFILFLTKLIPDDEIRSASDRANDLKERRYLKTVQDFIDIEKHTHRIDSLCRRDDLTDNDRIRLELLLLHKQRDQPGEGD